MIKTTGNVIALVTLLSGVHAHFANHPDEAAVELVYGDHRLGEQFVVTSDKMVGEVRLYIYQSSICITYTHEGSTYYSEYFHEFEQSHRKRMREIAVELLNGTVVYEVV